MYLLIAFGLATAGYMVEMWKSYKESKKKSHYNDPNDLFYH
jgi:hypothetical protein